MLRLILGAAALLFPHSASAEDWGIIGATSDIVLLLDKESRVSDELWISFVSTSPSEHVALTKQLIKVSCPSRTYRPLFTVRYGDKGAVIDSETGGPPNYFVPGSVITTVQDFHCNQKTDIFFRLPDLDPFDVRARLALSQEHQR